MSLELALARMANHVVRRHDRWRLRRFRRAYAKVSGHRSRTPGYAGLIEELRWGLERLDARTLARVAPISLRFLVGEIRVAAPAVNFVPECRFRREAGETLCREVCRRPTEAFTSARGLPVVLEPQADGHSCRWIWRDHG